MVSVTFSRLRDPEDFRAVLADRGLSTRALAALVSDEGHPLSFQRVGQLRVGHSPRVNTDLARAIERALRVRRGRLFTRNERRKATAA